MFFPLFENTDAAKGTPLVRFLVLLNVAIYIVCMIFNQTFPLPDNHPLIQEYLANTTHVDPRGVTGYALYVYLFAFSPFSPTVTSSFLSLFLHSSLIHIFMNMYILMIFGGTVEKKIGPFWFVLIYFASGILGNYATVLYHASMAGNNLVGASSALFGVLGTHMVFAATHRVKTLVFLPPLVWQVVKLPSRLLFFYFFLLSNLLPFLASGVSKCAYIVHLAGFFFGIFGAGILFFAIRYFPRSAVTPATPPALS